MSTIKISELASSAISLTDFFAKADASGVASKNDIQGLSNFLNTVGTLAFRGVLLAADAAVTEDGIYVAGDDGTYTNNGGLVITLGNQIVLISITGTQTVFEKVQIPITVVVDSVPVEGGTDAISSGGVFESLRTLEQRQESYTDLLRYVFKTDVAPTTSGNNFYKIDYPEGNSRTYTGDFNINKRTLNSASAIKITVSDATLLGFYSTTDITSFISNSLVNIPAGETALKVPSGANYVFFNVLRSGFTSETILAESLDITELINENTSDVTTLEADNETNKKNIVDLNTLTKIQFGDKTNIALTTTDGFRYSPSGGTLSQPGFKISDKINLTTNLFYLLSSQGLSNAIIANIVFFDNSDVFVGNYLAPNTNKFNDYLIQVPEGATKIAFTFNSSDTDFSLSSTNAIDSNNYIDKKQIELKDKGFEFRNINNLFPVDIEVSENIFSLDFLYTDYNGTDKIVLRYARSSDGLIRISNETTSTTLIETNVDTTTRTFKEVYSSDAKTYLKIDIDLSNIDGGYLYDILVKPKTFTKDTVLWLGTSIPEGASYPRVSCSKSNLLLYNNSVGSSNIGTTQEIIDLTYIAPSYNSNLGKSLGETVAEKESYCGAVSTSAQLEVIRGYSFERRVLPYIDGTLGSAKIVVMDHGFNDRARISNDFANGVTVDSTDRTTFFGAFNFIVNKIKEVNPYCTIVIAGHYENQTNAVDAPFERGSFICDAQTQLAEYHLFPICKTWENSGFSYRYIPNSSSFLSTYNSTYGTSYVNKLPDASLNVIALQYYMPDGVHPHSDKSGNTNKILDAIFSRFIKLFS
tara:strand:+ start:48 stop:2474 length:2427 start_codon:yes stop_codon:yes gene_type:complete